MLKALIVIVGLSVYPFSSVSFCFVYFEATLIHTFKFKLLNHFVEALYHHDVFPVSCGNADSVAQSGISVDKSAFFWFAEYVVSNIFTFTLCASI